VIKDSDLYPVRDEDVQEYRRQQLAGDVPVPPWHAVTEEGREQWRKDYREALLDVVGEEGRGEVKNGDLCVDDDMAQAYLDKRERYLQALLAGAVEKRKQPEEEEEEEEEEEVEQATGWDANDTRIQQLRASRGYNDTWSELSEEDRDHWRLYFKWHESGARREYNPVNHHITTRAELNEIIGETFKAIHALNNTKGQEYAGDADALANFRNRAEQLDLDPLKVWGIFFGKHADAIFAFIRRGKVLSEPIEGRIDDAILYLILLRALVKERGL